MKIGWGWKIAIMYGGFVVLISTLVIASNRQHFDLVSKDYYEKEIGFQKTIDAGKNQSALSAPMSIHASSDIVTIEFPEEFKGRLLSGDVHFYSPVDAAWDKSFKVSTNSNAMSVPRSALHNTRYTIQINCIADGKSYYQESEILLHP